MPCWGAGGESLQRHVREHYLPLMHLKNVVSMEEHARMCVSAKSRPVQSNHFQDKVSLTTTKTPAVMALLGGICAVKMKGQ